MGGDAIEIQDDEIPVFHTSGDLELADFSITHHPGYNFVTDLPANGRDYLEHRTWTFLFKQFKCKVDWNSLYESPSNISTEDLNRSNWNDGLETQDGKIHPFMHLGVPLYKCLVAFKSGLFHYESYSSLQYST